MSSGSPDAVSLLERARASRDDLEARLLLCAALQRVARDVGVHAVVTGGTSVDFYVAGAAGTSGNYPEKWRPSGDVDIVALAVRGVTDTRETLIRAFERELGLTPHVRGRDASGREVLGRKVTVDDFPYGLEIVGDELGGDPHGERVFTVEIEGVDVPFRGPEDTLLSYAESGWHFHAPRDWERALAIARTMRDEMDFDYLRRRAKDRGMPGVLEEALAGRPLPDAPRPLS